ncbi:MAG: hypothetical protein JWO92_2143 [Chitinophagaceae bacterium]|nr:hypothetical protein [Chitinophagaceae bacterium]
MIGKFCHNCGQENIEPKESVWHLVSHFFKDVTHFDGKFFTSLKDLILRPGFLSKEYMVGRRASYLNPVRMYLFTSAIFFLIFFSLYTVDEKGLTVSSVLWGRTADEVKHMDSVQFNEFTRKINNGKPLTRAEVTAMIDTSGFHIAPGNFHSKEEYDSLLKAGVKKHNWIERQLVYKDIEIKKKYGSNPKLIIAALLNRFLHSLPQMLFVLLPLFALILKLVYVRRKQFYYVDHIIFTIHFYIFIFLVMLVTFGISKLKNLLHWEWLKYIVLVFILSIFFYFYKALRNFYKQRRAKTILKYFILLFLFLVIIVFMFIIFIFLSLFGL